MNKPEDWTDGNHEILVEPFIEGTYAKFNSNSGWVNEGYKMMQALSHFSFDCTHGHSYSYSFSHAVAAAAVCCLLLAAAATACCLLLLLP